MVYLWMLSHKRFTELWHPCYEDSCVVAIQSFFEELPKRSPGTGRRESLLQFFGAALRLDEQRGTSLSILAESLTSDGLMSRRYMSNLRCTSSYGINYSQAQSWLSKSKANVDQLHQCVCNVKSLPSDAVKITYYAELVRRGFFLTGARAWYGSP
ncbi:unnamed protein product [Fusarium graminearum]|uniref:Chromosome 4, complete genome n=1 Tax=Gibberella zeae (strain ATCC MYA-4620 / CBS 123657 / FGSC 9075 / NRRL 31084 / PH-1) TaxID=229533 RepID=A0A098DU04_GIBZE|nr:unnamed protein product [Fusarium graminearum]